jgi:chromosome segregation ATPase
MPPAFDALAYVHKLRDAGLSEQQAEAHAEALAAAMTDSLATKHDLREQLAQIDTRFAQIDLRFAQIDTRFVEVHGRLDQLEARFDGKLAALEHRITLRFGGIVVTAFGAFATLVKLF